MIGAQAPRDTMPVEGGVEQAAQVEAGDGASVHADAYDPPRELIHDDEHSIGPQHEGFAAQDVDAPQAVCGGVRSPTTTRGRSHEEGR